MMSQVWTEKYRPASLSQVIGNPKAVSDLTNWANSWNEGIPDKRAVVLVGTPGIGKTSAAVALANDMKWDVVEMNASDQRTGDAIRSVALKGANFNTFMSTGEYADVKDGGRKLIILDEADSLFGREDRGGLPAISELIKTTKQPVILIVNDLYALSKKSAAVKSNTLQITFMRPRIDVITRALDNIAKCENISVDQDALRKMAENSNGDMRAAVRNLESLSLGRSSVTSDDAVKLSDRIIRKDIYNLMNSIFREKDAIAARNMMRDVDETPDHIMMWIDENMPYEFRDKGDLVRGYERLARADVFMGRVHRRQYYGFQSYARDLMSSGISISRRSDMISKERFRFPLYLMKMSRSKNVRALKENICSKLSSILHTSTSRISNDVLPLLKVMLKNDTSLTRSLTADAGLEAEEVAFLLDAKIDSEKVKEVMSSDTREPIARKIAEEIPETVTDDVKETKDNTQPGAQKSLFQF